MRLIRLARRRDVRNGWDRDNWQRLSAQWPDNGTPQEAEMSRRGREVKTNGPLDEILREGTVR